VGELAVPVWVLLTLDGLEVALQAVTQATQQPQSSLEFNTTVPSFHCSDVRGLPLASYRLRLLLRGSLLDQRGLMDVKSLRTSSDWCSELFELRECLGGDAAAASV